MEQVRPVIYCEVSGRSCADVTSLLKSHAYKLWDGKMFSDASAPEITHCARNTVAIPQEKVFLYVNQDGSN